MANVNEKINDTWKVQEDYLAALKKLEGKNLDKKVCILLGKNTTAAEKIQKNDPAYKLLLENMAVITALYSRK